MIRLTLPLPPSVNALWRSVRGTVVKSDPYKAWLTEAGYALSLARQKPVAGSYELVLSLPLKMRGDIDNRFKAVSDLLVAHKLIDDDRFAQGVQAFRSADPDPDKCIVTVTAYRAEVAA